MEIYVANEVANIIAIHPYLADKAFKDLSICEQISLQAKTLLEGHQQSDKRIAMHVGSWWPKAVGRPIEELLRTPFTRDDAELTISREYGFSGFDDVKKLGYQTINAKFDKALDVMLAGNFSALEQLLVDNADLATACSYYGHQSTLLHYIGANGVESHRQVTPLNAPKIASLLISFGADINAKANMYGGGQTAFALASTSAHPHNAGVSEALNLVLSGRLE